MGIPGDSGLSRLCEASFMVPRCETPARSPSMVVIEPQAQTYRPGLEARSRALVNSLPAPLVLPARLEQSIPPPVPAQVQMSPVRRASQPSQMPVQSWHTYDRGSYSAGAVEGRPYDLGIAYPPRHFSDAPAREQMPLDTSIRSVKEGSCSANEEPDVKATFEKKKHSVAEKTRRGEHSEHIQHLKSLLPGEMLIQAKSTTNSKEVAKGEILRFSHIYMEALEYILSQTCSMVEAQRFEIDRLSRKLAVRNGDRTEGYTPPPSVPASPKDAQRSLKRSRSPSQGPRVTDLPEERQSWLPSVLDRMEETGRFKRQATESRSPQVKGEGPGSPRCYDQEDMTASSRLQSPP